ncbi:MAG TPA: hypothetical protein VGS20_01350 [Candidatus Acidoferrales bacterium]|nr:hypothetical protein [Candidatus Acidoferrales bacterium]
MKASLWLAGTLLVLGTAASARPNARKQVFYGSISASSCGLHHPDADPVACTKQGIANGSKYVLADEKNQKVYQLSDQTKPAPFAGLPVQVVGTLEGDTIQVASIAAPKAPLRKAAPK